MDNTKQRFHCRREAGAFMKGFPEIPSLTVYVEGRAAVPQVAVRLFLIGAQVAPESQTVKAAFLRSNRKLR